MEQSTLFNAKQTSCLNLRVNPKDPATFNRRMLAWDVKLEPTCALREWIRNHGPSREYLVYDGQSALYKGNTSVCSLIVSHTEIPLSCLASLVVSHSKHPVLETDVLIVGSGPIGATYARKLVDAGGIDVLMVEIGAQERPIVGDHKKNSVPVQKDINNFTKVVQGEMDLLSIPMDRQETANVEPASFSTNKSIWNGQNPLQESYDNLPVAAATRVVGGMGSHWTYCTPRQHPTLERSDIFTDAEWDELYTEAEALMNTNRTDFNHSIRQQLVLHVLRDAYNRKEGKNKPAGRLFEPMPLACKRNKIGNNDFVRWSCSATVFGDITNNNPRFTLKSQHQCERLLTDDSGNICGAVVKDLMEDTRILVRAKKYVVCAGATLTPGILYASGFRPERGSLPALGRYLTEQVMAFCQVVLLDKLVKLVANTGKGSDPWHLGWDKIVEKHKRDCPKDPLPFPFNDPDPQVTTPLSEEWPWHTQIHRDAFGYGQTPANIDQRVVVDLRFYSFVKPIRENCVEFSNEYSDQYGMPQPTYHFRIPEEDAERAHRMMKDMVEVSSHLGGFLPGAEPKYLPPGSALHICGTTRAGNSVEDSVVDRNSKVWGTDNLYLGGCNVIPTQNACNPTLTAMCFAIVGAKAIVAELIETKTQTPRVPVRGRSASPKKKAQK